MRPEEGTLMKEQITGIIIHNLASLLAVLFALVWFGWKGCIVAFLLNWASNTEHWSRV